MKNLFNVIMLTICGFIFTDIFTNEKLLAADTKEIVFVCTGNTCRSPMAEGIAKKFVADKKLDYKISSRGTKIDPKEVVANPKSIEVMKSRNIDISKHQSKMFSKEDITNASLILTMTDSHKKGLLDLFPDAAPYTFTITEYATGKDGNISDPWGKEIEEYIKTAEQLDILVPQAIEKFNSAAK
ncbi:low molecular weight protein arginine phosphatase [Fusobacterium sp. PH5-44]|uniref:low molecular weight protein arginine phosphatase n=1 Tax=unclassified Fusobacterium TaxID=2648384 RepID=UPI003D1F410E